MSIINRIRMWWYRSTMHEECVEWQLQDAPLDACIKCLSRMEWMRAQMLAKARILSEH